MQQQSHQQQHLRQQQQQQQHLHQQSQQLFFCFSCLCILCCCRAAFRMLDASGDGNLDLEDLKAFINKPPSSGKEEEDPQALG